MRKVSLLMAMLLFCSILFVGCKPAKGKITLKIYDKIENWMTYEEVIDIIGSEGKLYARSGDEGTDRYTVVYKYEGNNGEESSASFTFQGNPLVLKKKVQEGLK